MIRGHAQERNLAKISNNALLSGVLTAICVLFTKSALVEDTIQSIREFDLQSQSQRTPLAFGTQMSLVSRHIGTSKEDFET